MSTTFPFDSPFDLSEFSMIAGSNQELVFAVYDENGNSVSLSGATITWYLAPFGYSNYEISKVATSGSETNNFVVNLIPSDTISLSGKYVHQYLIVDSSGSYFRPSQGFINIYPALL